MPGFERAVLISDLHLLESRPAINRAFFQLLEQLPGRTDALFILGDFFEYWVGDDAASAFHLDIADRLRAVAARLPVHLMVGNRDFALGEDFARRCGATLLTDPTRVRLGTTTWLLSHGDALCTDDKAYQRFRRIIRHPLVLGTLRRLPRRWRIGLAKRLRRNSRARFEAGRGRYVDVNQAAVHRCLEAEPVTGLIHGHTHMADWHYHRLASGRTAERLVLGDWHELGWYLRFDGADRSLNRFRIDSGPDLADDPA